MGCSLSMLQKKNGNKKGGDGEKKEKVSVVLKVDCLCDGCAEKITKHIRGFEGIIKFLRLSFLDYPFFSAQIFETCAAFVVYSVLLCFLFLQGWRQCKQIAAQTK